MKNPAYLPLLTAVLLGCAKQSSEPAQAPPKSTLSVEQELVVASFELDDRKVETLLGQGVDVNARMGSHDDGHFKDEWTLGFAMMSSKWTPLLALANSDKIPQPEKETQNTSEALAAAYKEMAEVDPAVINERNQRRVAIGKLLVAAKADLNADDGHGATALYDAIDKGYEELALLLIDAGAEVNTKTGVYIDGTGDITSLHRAIRHPRLVDALLRHGANPSVTDDTGRSPLHWAIGDSQAESVRLLIAAGAEVNAKDNQGRTTLSSARLFDPEFFPVPENEEEANRHRLLFGDPKQQTAIREMLEQAGVK